MHIVQPVARTLDCIVRTSAACSCVRSLQVHCASWPIIYPANALIPSFRFFLPAFCHFTFSYLTVDKQQQENNSEAKNARTFKWNERVPCEQGTHRRRQLGKKDKKTIGTLIWIMHLMSSLWWRVRRAYSVSPEPWNGGRYCQMHTHDIWIACASALILVEWGD